MHTDPHFGKKPALWCYAVLALALVLLAACGSEAGDSAPPAAPTRTLIPPTPTPTALPITPTITPTDLPGPETLGTASAPETSGPLPASAQAVFDRALADLAGREGVDAAGIRLIGLEAMTWPDAALGCDAAPAGQAGAVPGYRLLFSAGRALYVYHADQGETVLLCEEVTWSDWQGEPIAPDPIAQSMVSLAVRDAARQLAASEDAIGLASLLAVDWPDSSIGCPKPNIDYADQDEPGFRIVLRAGDAELIYHTSIRHVVRCAPEEEILPGLLRPLITPATTP